MNVALSPTEPREPKPSMQTLIYHESSPEPKGYPIA
jgi:hypothetical protein